MSSDLERQLEKYDSSASALERPAYVRTLLSGRHKVGKTTAAAHCGERPRIYACDNGWTALKDWPEVADRVDVTVHQGWKHFKAFVSALVEDLPIYQKNDHIIIDPATKLVREYVLWLQDAAQTPGDESARVRWNRKPGNDDPDFEPFTTAGMGDYNATLTYFRKTFYPLFKINKHITLIAHDREPSFMDTARGKKPPPITAAFPGQTYAMIAQEMDFIAHMEVDGDKRIISFRPSDKEDAGSRIRALHGQAIDATKLPELYRKWN